MVVGRAVVFGGNGLVGAAICRAVARCGFEVVSISRRGVAPPSAAGWGHTVQWVKGDALDPSTYAGVLDGAKIVVSTIGTLIENDSYKRVLRGKDHARYGKQTYEVINLATAETIVGAAAHAQAEALLYLSAAACPPGVDKRYLTTKREAEVAVLNAEGVRGVVFRPGFMYSDDAPATMAVGAAMLLAGKLSKRFSLPTATAATALGMDVAALQPLSTTAVGDAAAMAALHSDVEGVYSPAMIADLAQRHSPS